MLPITSLAFLGTFTKTVPRSRSMAMAVPREAKIMRVAENDFS